MVKTPMYCHNCEKDFTAELGNRGTGCWEIVCPHCDHIHYRVIENGKVTGERYRSSMQQFTSTTSTTAYYGTDIFISSSWNNTITTSTTTWHT